ncbi:MAG: hypothetical protein WCK29_02355 [archaeon]
MSEYIFLDKNRNPLVSDGHYMDSTSNEMNPSKRCCRVEIKESRLDLIYPHKLISATGHHAEEEASKLIGLIEA